LWWSDYPLACDELTGAPAIGDTEGDDDLRLLTRMMLIIVHGGLGDESLARQVADEAVQLARNGHDRCSEAVALTGLCWLNAAMNRFDDQVTAFEEMREAAEDSQDPLWIGLAPDNMAELLLWQGPLLRRRISRQPEPAGAGQAPHGIRRGRDAAQRGLSTDPCRELAGRASGANRR
jgi:hypothetical protein